MQKPKFDYITFDIIESLTPFFNKIFNDEICIAITDQTKFIYVSFGKNFTLPYKVGDPINQAIQSVISQDKIIEREIPRSIMQHSNSIEAKCYFFPIRENDQVIGCLSIAIHLENKCELEDIISLLTNTSLHMNESIHKVTSGVTELTNMNAQLLNRTTETAKKAAATDNIVNFIQGISSKTNLLGLNASIEAARSGENGRGFAVVANEIQKLSVSSKESISKIDSIVKDISTQVKEIDSGLAKINTVSEEQSDILNDLEKTMEEINTTIQKLQEISKRI